jgi:chromatin segregation and condensation protein Rec8/ScpA/Scc1 (kleisin family)
MSLMDLNSQKQRSLMHVQETDNNGVIKWMVEKNGEKKSYDAYDKLPEDVKEMLAMRRTHGFLKQGQNDNSSSFRRVDRKIEISRNRKEEMYDPSDEVPEELKEFIGLLPERLNDFNSSSGSKADFSKIKGMMSNILKKQSGDEKVNIEESSRLPDNPMVQITDKAKYTSGSLLNTKQIYMIVGFVLLLVLVYMGLMSI